MSNLSAFDLIAEGSKATPGLFNRVFSTLSANINAINSDLTLNLPSGETFSLFTNLDVSRNIHAGQQIGIGTTPSAVTTAVMTIAANSSTSDYIHFEDPTGGKSNYMIGSRVGGTADGLNLWDLSGDTMIASFSKQSIRFFQNVVGPVFDVGGALADTYNAATFGTGADSLESRIQSAIDQASIDGVSRVYLPANMYPYSASSVSFIYTVQMVREGGNWSVYDIQAYGARADGSNDYAALFACMRSADGKTVVLGDHATYSINSRIILSGTCPNGVRVTGNGSTIKAIAPFTGSQLISGTTLISSSGAGPFEFYDTTFDGNYPTVEVIPLWGQWRDGVLSNCVFRGGRSYQVNSVFSNMRLSAISIVGATTDTDNGFDCGVTDSLIDRITVNMSDNTAHSAFWLNSAKRVVVSGLRTIGGLTGIGLEDCQDVVFLEANVSGITNFGAPACVKISNSSCTNISFVACTMDGNGLNGYRITPSNGISIIGGKIANCSYGVDIIQGNPDRISLINVDVTESVGTAIYSTTGSIFSGGVRTRGCYGISDMGKSLYTLTDAATIVVDVSKGDFFVVTLGGNRTMGGSDSVTRVVGSEILFKIIQDGTGLRNLFWSTLYKHAWSNAGNDANKFSTIKFVWDGANWVQVGSQSPYLS